MKHRQVSLKVFLRGTSNPKEQMPGCANYDHDHGGCLFADACQVEQGQRCSYFERAVLPTAADTGQKEHICGLYEEQTGATLVRDDLRLCADCGDVELRLRQRYCDDCARKRRQKTNRDNLRKYRVKKRACA